MLLYFCDLFLIKRAISFYNKLSTFNIFLKLFKYIFNKFNIFYFNILVIGQWCKLSLLVRKMGARPQKFSNFSGTLANPQWLRLLLEFNFIDLFNGRPALGWWCGRWESNPQGIATTGTWNLRVCHFATSAYLLFFLTDYLSISAGFSLNLRSATITLKIWWFSGNPVSPLQQFYCKLALKLF